MTDELLRDLANDLPYERPSATRRDALRASLVAEAGELGPVLPAAQRRWPLVAAFVAGAAAAAAIAIVIARSAPTTVERTNLAQVTATSPGVRIDHQIVATDTGSDEVVRIREGTIALAIPAQRRGDRVLIQTTTAEVEGDAGDLEVTVARDQLQTVRVKSGTARVIVLGQAPVTLSAGQTWRASVITSDLSPTANDAATGTAAAPPTAADATGAGPVATTSAVMDTDARKTSPVTATASAPLATRPPVTPPAVAATPTAPPATSAVATGSAVTSTPPAPIAAIASAPSGAPAVTPPKPASIEQRFQAGWALLRAGKAQQAADELGAAADASPEAPLAADARYFQAVALVRANDPRAAERVLVQFLDSAPKSLRRGRAAVLLGRLLAERGDRSSARAWLETAVTDPDPAIAAAAKAGLQTLK